VAILNDRRALTRPPIRRPNLYAATKRKAETNGGNYEPTLTAITKNLGDRVEIRIRDNRAGIPPEVIDKMFNPFFTTSGAKGGGQGECESVKHGPDSWPGNCATGAGAPANRGGQSLLWSQPATGRETDPLKAGK
jgi:hypothetical protein